MSIILSTNLRILFGNIFLENNAIQTFVARINKKCDESLTEDDVVEIIQNIGNIHCHKKFAYHDEDDMRGQIALICLDRISKYDPEKSSGTSIKNKIERFLNTTVKNRLITFYRDSCGSVNEDYRRTRMNLMNCLPMDNVDAKEFNRRVEDVDFTDNLIYEELTEFVESGLMEIDPSGDLINIYYDLIANESVTAYYRAKLNDALNKLLTEWNELHVETD